MFDQIFFSLSLQKKVYIIFDLLLDVTTMMKQNSEIIMIFTQKLFFSICPKNEETIVGTNVCFPHFENHKFCHENFPNFNGKISTLKKEKHSKQINFSFFPLSLTIKIQNLFWIKVFLYQWLEKNIQFSNKTKRQRINIIIVDLGLENCSPTKSLKRHFVEISLNKHKTLMSSPQKLNF